jgi:hypothetical protein
MLAGGRLLVTSGFPLTLEGKGVSKKACVSPLGAVPVPTIWPASLMSDALSSSQFEPVGMSVLRSVISPPLQIKARVFPPLSVAAE